MTISRDFKLLIEAMILKMRMERYVHCTFNRIRISLMKSTFHLGVLSNGFPTTYDDDADADGLDSCSL